MLFEIDTSVSEAPLSTPRLNSRVLREHHEHGDEQEAGRRELQTHEQPRHESSTTFYVARLRRADRTHAREDERRVRTGSNGDGDEQDEQREPELSGSSDRGNDIPEAWQLHERHRCGDDRHCAYDRSPGQKRSFEHELSDDLRPPRAHNTPHADFLGTRGCLCGRKVGVVEARSEQHDRAEEVEDRTDRNAGFVRCGYCAEASQPVLSDWHRPKLVHVARRVRVARAECSEAAQKGLRSERPSAGSTA